MRRRFDNSTINLARRFRSANTPASWRSREGGMFWQSSARGSDSSDSDSSSDHTQGSAWSRVMPSPKTKRPSKHSRSVAQSPWYARWFSSDTMPLTPKRSHHSRHRRAHQKSRARTCRPKSSQGWGVVSF